MDAFTTELRGRTFFSYSLFYALWDLIVGVNKNNHRENLRENFEKSVTSVSHAISTSSTFSVLYFAVALTYQEKYKKAKSELT